MFPPTECQDLYPLGTVLSDDHLVATSLLEAPIMFFVGSSINLTAARLLRVMRLVRILRVVRLVRFFRQLRVVVKARGSAGAMASATQITFTIACSSRIFLASLQGVVKQNKCLFASLQSSLTHSNNKKNHNLELRDFFFFKKKGEDNQHTIT